VAFVSDAVVLWIEVAPSLVLLGLTVAAQHTTSVEFIFRLLLEQR